MRRIIKDSLEYNINLNTLKFFFCWNVYVEPVIDNNVLLKNWLVIKQKKKQFFFSIYCNYCRTTIIKIIMESPISFVSFWAKLI